MSEIRTAEEYVVAELIQAKETISNLTERLADEELDNERLRNTVELLRQQYKEMKEYYEKQEEAEDE